MADEITLNVDNTLVTPGYVDSQDAQMLASANAYANGLKLETDAQIAKKADAHSYELIETITLTQAVSAIKRTQEPGGAAYKFRSMIVHGKVQSVTGTAPFYANIYQGTDLVLNASLSNAISSDAMRYFKAVCKEDCGIYDSYITFPLKWDSAVNNNLSEINLLPLNDAVGINNLQIYTLGDTFAIGSEFEIWGIRL